MSVFAHNNYDYSKSTEDNYAQDGKIFVGKYAAIRESLDYSYHKYYNIKRQFLQDEIIEKFLHIIRDKNECVIPTNNWLVFTAGCMGAGKGKIISWLTTEGLFPNDAFVKVDPGI